MIVLIVILTIIAIAGIVITTGLRKSCNNPEDRWEVNFRRKLGTIRAVIVGACVVIFGIAMLVSGIKIIDQTEIGVVKTFGRVDHTISGGLNFVNPITDTVEVMDLRVHVNESAFASYTKDAQPVTASVEYQYELSAGNAMTVATQYGTYEILETKLGAAAEERAKIVFSRYGAMTLLETPRCGRSSRSWKNCSPSTSPMW